MEICYIYIYIYIYSAINDVSNKLESLEGCQKILYFKLSIDINVTFALPRI